MRLFFLYDWANNITSYVAGLEGMLVCMEGKYGKICKLN